MLLLFSGETFKDLSLLQLAKGVILRDDSVDFM